MYLAIQQNGSVISYQIRQSYEVEENVYRYQIVYDLGQQPTQLLEHFDNDIVLFNDELLEAVSSRTQEDGDAVLERLLWDFLPPQTQNMLIQFPRRKTLKISPLSGKEKRKIFNQIHLFDRRRLYYLRYGAVDQSRLSRLHEKCCRPLLGQSRDEREFYFRAAEMVIEPGNYLQYIYAIFNIQQHFHQSFAPWLPEALAREEMGDHFIKDLCRLNGDSRYWQGEDVGHFLHPHLQRYLFMFFDFVPAPRSFLNDFSRTFMAGHRKFRWPERKSSRSPEQVSEIFEEPFDALKKMNKEQLGKLYRKKAMKLHPDRGGDHNLFIELTEVYDDLLRTR